MSEEQVVISARLVSALGIAAAGRLLRVGPDGVVAAAVDDVDRRYRDAIKSGARPKKAPAGSGGARCAELEDIATGRLVRLMCE